jgi:hypothetical protein
MVPQALKVLLVLQVFKVSKEILANGVLRVFLVLMVLTVNKDPRVYKVHKAVKETLVLPVSLVV